jgi:hypothetical protein
VLPTVRPDERRYNQSLSVLQNEPRDLLETRPFDGPIKTKIIKTAVLRPLAVGSDEAILVVDVISQRS